MSVSDETTVCSILPRRMTELFDKVVQERAAVMRTAKIIEPVCILWAIVVVIDRKCDKN